MNETNETIIRNISNFQIGTDEDIFFLVTKAKELLVQAQLLREQRGYD